MVKQHIVFLTGAGVSAESGLATFRGKNGLWTNNEWQYLASTDGLYYDTEKSLEFYNWRRKQLAEVQPNQEHLLIAELEKEHKVTIITQNVDDLHERAGSSNVIHLHGELRKVCSSKNRYDPSYIKDYPLTTPIRVGDDAGDGSQMRPYIVLFGEYVNGIEEAQGLVGNADIFVVVGTSLLVYPANNLILYAHKEIPKFVINPDDMPYCEKLGYTHIKTTATDGMKILVKKIQKRKLNQ